MRHATVSKVLAAAAFALFASAWSILPAAAQTADAPAEPAPSESVTADPVPAEPAAPTPTSATIPSGHKFIMRLETPMHTRTTRKGDEIEFTLAADVVADNEVLIPNKSLVRATVTKSKRAGRISGRSEIRLQFNDVRLPDGTELPIKATITRMGFDPVDAKEGDDPELKGEAGAGGDAKDVAGASAQGAIIGVLTGGARGAVYGAAAGAAISAIGMMLLRGPDLDLPRSTMFEAQFDGPVEVPLKALQARNAPPPAAAPESRVAEAVPESGRTRDRPVLKRPGRERQTGETEPSGPTAAAEAGAVPEIPEEAPDTAEAVPVPEAAEAAPAPPPAPPSGAGAEPPYAGSAAATIRVRVRMVQVDAVVRDRSGRLIDNLTADDFRVYEDGVLQEIQAFSRDELPLAVALVIDRSGSVSPFIAALRRLAAQALDQLKEKDEVCLFSFADSTDRLEDLTTDRRRIANAIDRIRAGGGTNITDALHDAVAYLARVAPDRRHSIILISDNDQTVNPTASESATIRTAMETETVVYSLKTSGTGGQLGMQLPTLILGSDPVGKITRETGGEIINVGRVSSLDSALGSVISRLRMRYSIGYYPSGTAQGGAFHAITVRLTDRHGKPGSDYFMHAKRGYYATGTSAASAAFPAPAAALVSSPGAFGR